jgi:cytoskeletal protein RodZ
MPRRWVFLGVWGAITLVLFGGSLVVWLNHQSGRRVQQIQAQYDQAMADHVQTQADHQREITHQQNTARERETGLASQLADVQAQLEKTASNLDQERRASGQLRAELDQLATRTTEVLAEREALAHKLTAANAGMAAMNVRSSLAAALERVVGGMRSGVQQQEEPTVANAAVASPQPELISEARSGERYLPAQPPRLDGSELAPGFRPILAPRTN